MNDDTDITPRDLAEQAIALHPKSTAAVLGIELSRLISLHAPHLESWREELAIKALGRYCNTVKAQLNQEGAPRVTYDGRPMTSTISVNGQLKLWTECSPAEFVEAVLREQNVVDGRDQSNRSRRAFVNLLRQREDLMAMPTLGDAAQAAGWDVAALDLDELAP